MPTMLYDAETLEPQILISEDIKNGDIGKKFWAINGCWDGTFNGDSIVVHNPCYADHVPNMVFKCYKFKSKPPEEYYKLFDSHCMKDLYAGINYNAWFAYFDDLVGKGEVNV